MFGLFGGRGGGGHGSNMFSAHYRAYPVSFLDPSKHHLEFGDKCILPPSALDALASLRIQYPMLFEISNPRSGTSGSAAPVGSGSESTAPDSLHAFHCGVLEFVADEGMVYMPYWMMQNLSLSEGDVVQFKSASLPKGTYVKLQPHTSTFLDISNPKAVLERSLRTFTCLTVGQFFRISYNDRTYDIDVIELKPSSAVSIVETDCEVDFAAPLDYVEPTRPTTNTSASIPTSASGPAPSEAAGTSGAAKEGGEEEEEEDGLPRGYFPVDGKHVTAFTGTSHRLDGKTSTNAGPVEDRRALALEAAARRAAAEEAKAAKGGGAKSADKPAKPGDAKKPERQASGTRIVFGGGPAGGSSSKSIPQSSSDPSKPAKPPARKEEEKKADEEPPKSSFEAFKGRANTLK